MQTKLTIRRNLIYFSNDVYLLKILEVLVHK